MSSIVSSRSRIAEYSAYVDDNHCPTAMLREHKRALGVVHTLDERRDLSAELRKRPDVLIELEWAHNARSLYARMYNLQYTFTRSRHKVAMNLGLTFLRMSGTHALRDDSNLAVPARCAC